MSENDAVRLPEVIVFAGPNGSGKSTITRMAKIGGSCKSGKILHLRLYCLLTEICCYCKERKKKDILSGELSFNM